MLTDLASCVLLTLLSVVSTVEASPWRASSLRSRTTYAVKDTHNVPKQWSRISAAPKDHVLELQIALKQSRFDELEKHLYEVSDPDHVRYGQHLTEAEVKELVKPSDRALNSVEDWLFANHCNASQLTYSPAKDFISVALPVDQVESLLDTEYSVYQHKDGTHLVRTPEWSLPQHLHEHIESIQPTNSFFRPKPRRSHLKTIPGSQTKSAKKAPSPPFSNITVAEACDSEAVTPLCLRTLYQTINYTPQVPGKNKIGLNNFLGEGPFVTSVGATKNFPEVVAFDASNDFASGGGFSNYFPRPAYQDSTIPPYLASLNGSFSGLFNPHGRGYPDISAQGYHFVTVWDGEETLLDGTSASCPTASAVLSLVNDALLAEGKSPLGFLNPWLYKRGFKAFTDVVSGSAIGCGVDGFPAVKGWDVWF